MRALFLIPGDSSQQLQAFPAVAAVADQLQAQVQVVCAAETAGLWGLHPGVTRAIPFNFVNATLADWANLLGSVREPDFQLCISRASGRQVDLTLAMSHIPTRVAEAGFSATARVQATQGLWPGQAWEAWLRPVGVTLDAAAYRLPVAPAQLQAAAAALPAGDGPLLMQAPAGGEADWPATCWQELPALIRQRLPGLRSATLAAGSWQQRAASLACADVVLASEPASIDLAILLGLPLVALGRSPQQLPPRQEVKALGQAGSLRNLDSAAVLTALGLS